MPRQPEISKPLNPTTTACAPQTQPVSCRMTLIVTSLPQEALSNEWGQLSPDAALTLNAPGMDPLHVPLRSAPATEAELKQCTCWEWSGLAKDEGQHHC